VAEVVFQRHVVCTRSVVGTWLSPHIGPSTVVEKIPDPSPGLSFDGESVDELTVYIGARASARTKNETSFASQASNFRLRNGISKHLQLRYDIHDP
jgi:hypothetical protein